MSREWMIYTGGNKKRIKQIYDSIRFEDSDFEWKISEMGTILYFRPKMNQSTVESGKF
jgi:hypothetical protein